MQEVRDREEGRSGDRGREAKGTVASPLASALLTFGPHHVLGSGSVTAPSSLLKNEVLTQL